MFHNLYLGEILGFANCHYAQYFSWKNDYYASETAVLIKQLAAILFNVYQGILHGGSS